MRTMQQKTIFRLVASILATCVCIGAAQAQSNDALLNKLVQKGYLTQQEADDLKKEGDGGFDKAYRSRTGWPDWVTQLKLYGDLRGRWDFIKTDNDAPGAGEPNKDRSRLRYRFRVGATVQMKENLELGFRLTSAEPNAFGGDPISGNASFHDNSSKKFVYIDLAYGKWTPVNTGPWLLTGTIGKTENPFVFSDMVFDPDYTPEGIGIQSAYAIDKEHSLKFNAGFFILDEINQGSQASDDPYLLGAQLRYDAKWTSKLSSSAGIAWMGLSEEESLNNGAVPNINVGNTRYASATNGHLAGDLVADFAPVILDASVTYTLDSFPLYPGHFPIRVGGEYMVNPAADRMNEGYWLGFFLGKSGKKGTWELSYRYKRLEADAWYEEFVDSDTGAYRQLAASGSGQAAGYRPGTGLQGHVVRAAYSPADAFTVSLTYYLYELIDTPTVITTVGSIKESAAHRVQLDAIWKF
jgi:hypothetical protein